jgi:hypothetical protein
MIFASPDPGARSGDPPFSTAQNSASFTEYLHLQINLCAIFMMACTDTGAV